MFNDAFYVSVASDVKRQFTTATKLSVMSVTSVMSAMSVMSVMSVMSEDGLLQPPNCQWYQ